jgi:hypothetical protein
MKNPNGPLSRRSGWILALILILAGWPMAHGAEPVFISEFLAANDGGLLDEDGESSDWIEIYNSSGATMSLAGWYLTDDDSDLTKWQFPATNLLANDFLIVFASAKNRAVAGAPLHANFSLSSGGEYLALVKPDGVTIASQFAAPFQQQYDNVSYGVSQIVTTTRFIQSNAPVRVLVPTNGVLGVSWTPTNFVDSAWLAGTNGAGYESTVPGFSVKNFKANIVVNTLADAENVIATPGLQSAVYSENRSVVNYFNTGSVGNYASDFTFPGLTIGVDVEDFVTEATATITIPAAGQYTFGVNSDDGFRLTVGSFVNVCDCLRGPSDTLATFNFPSAGDYALRLVFWERGGGSEVELFAAAGALATFNPSNFRLVGDTAGGGLAVKSTPIAGGNALSFGSVIRTDVKTQMFARATSAYIRMPFNVTNTNTLSLTLQMKYDDGFVAYLNGTEVVRRNVSGSPQWNSAATVSRTNNAPLTAEQINISAFMHLLRLGTNMLAIHGLNDATNGSDFLIAAELVESRTTNTTNVVYFATPTPGTFNGSNSVAYVADTKFNPDRGFYDTNFSLTITSATAGATIYYTTNGTTPGPGNGFVYSSPIPIGGTLTVRAAAYRAGFQPSDVDTHTYLFVNDIVNQAPNGSAPPGWPATWGANVVDYGMDPDIVNNVVWGATIRDDLKALPVFSIVTSLSNLFDSATGIYANPGGAGPAWERPASMELIYPDGTEGFQINFGLRIRGGFSRSTDNPKHAFRALFREDYGAGKLKFPLFKKQSGADEFDGFDLRTFQNYSWSFGGDGNGNFMRDVLARDLQLLTGNQGERGDYYHLYVNGQYWGIYNTCERPEASYAATYFGGDKDDYDVIKVDPQSGYIVLATDGNQDAWFRLWQQATNGFASTANYQKVQGNNPDGTRNPAFENLLDVPNVIDYMLDIFYGGNLDAPISAFLGNNSPNNWYGSRSRLGTGGFRFFAHDSEHTLLNVNEDRTGPFPAGDPVTGGGYPKSNPQYLFQQLSANADFRMLVADRVQKHFFNGGAFSVESVRAQFMARSNELFRAVVAESARWGDSKRPTAPLTRTDWLGAVANTWNNFLPARTANVIAQLRAKALFPFIAAPSFNSTSGVVALGFPLTLTHTNVSGTIYYTLNGTDPRLPGGALNPAALAYSAPIVVNTFQQVRARVRNGSEWSAIIEGNFYPLQDFSSLLITEIMYHPPMIGMIDSDEFEFIELKNAGDTALDLSGATFTDGITFTFTNGTTLAPGQFFVLVRNSLTFDFKYPGVPYHGLFTGRLDNSGEKITLTHPLGAEIFSLTYNDNAPWPVVPDGNGFSLVPRDPDANPAPSSSANWRASSAIGGSPGSNDPPATIPGVVISELLSHTVLPQVDAIEIHNPTANAVNVGGWFLTDDSTVPKKYRIANGTVIQPGGYFSYSEPQFNAVPGATNSFSLNSFGEEVYLLSGDANTNLTGYSHGLSFGAAAQDVSFGRYLNSVGDELYPAQIANTFNAVNTGPRVGPVVINEIQYHPDTGLDEFIEIYNLTATNEALFDPLAPTNTWRLDGLSFTFPTNLTLAPNSFLLIVAIDPTVFRAKYGVAAGVQIIGPFAGQLQDSGENLELQRPGTPTTNGVPYIAIDAVRYNDKLPWPVSADGAGPSLQRLVTGAFGNDPTNWFASGNTPGRTNFFNAAPNVAVTSPAPNSTFIPPTNLTINADALDVDGTVTRVDFFANGISVGNDTNAPWSVTWSNATAGTYALTARARDDDFGVSISAPVPVVIFQPLPTTTIAAGSIWKYWDKGGDLGTAWTNLNYADNTWSNGPAQLGYGDGDETTVVGYGPDAANKYITTYFRRSFVLSNAPRYLSLQSSVRRDDGIVVYLNGTEIQRNNLNPGVVAFNTPAPVPAPDDGANWIATNVNSALLLNGTNILAVEVHQNGGGSSDLSFDLELTGTLGPVLPRIDITSPGTNSFFTSPANIMFSATASDIDGLLTSVKFLINGVEFVEFTNAPFTTNWNGVPLGTYTLTAIARNDGGLATTSAPVNITVVTNVFPFVALVDPTNGAAIANRTNLVLAATATDANGSVSKVEFFANGTKLGEDTTPPSWSFTWPLAPFGSHELYAVATDDQNARATSGVVNIGVLNYNSASATLISTGSIWRYFDKGLDLGTTWITTNSDLTWSNGPGQLGYGDGDEATIVSFGTNGGLKFPTTYFRRSFSVTNATSFISLNLGVRRDDGVAVYLNGTEIFRDNLPTGPVFYGTLASVAAPDDGATTLITNVNPALLIEGINVIAAEVHQNTAGSTDLSFELSLTGVQGSAPPVITLQPTNVVVAAGSNAMFTAGVAGSAPLRYQWKFFGTNLPGATNASLARSNVTSASAGNYFLVVTNGFGSATSQVATLSLPNADTDGDGMPDAWELAYGLLPNNAADANLDGDGDGLTNLEEYRAGTNPKSAASVLRLFVTSLTPLRLEFVAQPNLSYAVQFQTNVAAVPWFTLSNVPAQPLIRTVLVADPNPATNMTRFYRAVTP